MGGIERLREAHGARAEAAGARSSCLALNLWPAGGTNPLPYPLTQPDTPSPTGRGLGVRERRVSYGRN